MRKKLFQLIQNGHQRPFCEKMSAGIYFAHILESCILTRYGKKYDKNLFQVSTIAGGALQWREKHTLHIVKVTRYMFRTQSGASFVINFASLSPACAWPSLA